VVTVTLETGPAGAGRREQSDEPAAQDRLGQWRRPDLPGPDPASDIAAALKLGTAQGGAEVSKWAGKRPAPNGLVFLPDYAGGTNYVDFAALKQTGAPP